MERLPIDTTENKLRLEEYLFQSWSIHSDWIPEGCDVDLGGMTDGLTTLVSSDGAVPLDCLTCEDHEEAADTIIFAHIIFSYCSKLQQSVDLRDRYGHFTSGNISC